ncbi:MAG TPA: hypothetical protein VNI54_01340 [Thermoanaerobaculia bacterium]|nr:hypothetical protein [Thermoanaerobaculia bacterium]
MNDAPDERYIAVLDQHFLWKRDRPGYSMFGAKIGRLLLTDRRLLFLSTGSNGILHHVIFRSAPDTDRLDKSALGRRGSLALRLEIIQHTALSRRGDFSWFLIVRTKSAVYTFMTKYGTNKGQLEEFQAVLEETRAAWLASPDAEDIPDDR